MDCIRAMGYTSGCVPGNIVGECLGEKTCNDGIDNDKNGATDCNDLRCAGDPACAELICDDTLDNDGDGDFDCDDKDCDRDPACSGGGCAADETDYDDLARGYPKMACIDAMFGTSGCVPNVIVDNCMAERTLCDDGIDNDMDTRIDCADPDCTGVPPCGGPPPPPPK